MNTYTIAPRIFFIHDHPSPEQTLSHLFHDSHTMFQVRMNQLGNIKRVTTDKESQALRVMLETLIAAKQRLQSQNNS